MTFRYDPFSIVDHDHPERGKRPPEVYKNALTSLSDLIDRIPDQRIGQNIYNILRCNGFTLKDIFFIEDHAWVKMVDAYPEPCEKILDYNRKKNSYE